MSDYEDETNWRQRYDFVGASAWAWLVRARGLKRSAAILHSRIADEFDVLSSRARRGEPEAFAEGTEYELIGACLLLAGLALEGLIKGVWVSQHASEFTDGKLPNLLLSHDLRAICRRAGISVSDPGEQRLLEELTDVVVWVGRYPVPTKHDDYAPTPLPDGGMRWHAPGIRFDEENGTFAVFERLFERCVGYLKSDDDRAVFAAPHT